MSPSSEQAVQIYFVVHMATVGISHILRPTVWVGFFVRVREWGEPGVFAVGFLSVMFGSIIVAFHNVWEGIPLLVTLLGWAHVVKAAIYFAFPSVGLKALAKVRPETSGRYRVVGWLLLAVAGVVAYHLLSA